MILWSIQPVEVYKNLMHTGVYRCDFSKSSMWDFDKEYDWLTRRMNELIGAPPDNVKYPVWAWHTYYGKHSKPDLRHARWEFGTKGDKLVCIELEIADENVVLTDFDEWCIILNNGLLSDTEAEGQILYRQYMSLPEDQKTIFKHENWKRVFNISLAENEWMRRGEFIQATFWELRRDMVRTVRFFTAAERI